MFGALKKAFGGKAVELKAAARNIENKDMMEAAVDGMLLMAYSEDKKLGDVDILPGMNAGVSRA